MATDSTPKNDRIDKIDKMRYTTNRIYDRTGRPLGKIWRT